MAVVDPVPYQHKTDLTLLRESRQRFGLAPKSDWKNHSLALPVLLWEHICPLALRHNTSPSELISYAMHGLFIADPRRIPRREFAEGDAGDVAFGEVSG
jgi:hypothetical protein